MDPPSAGPSLNSEVQQTRTTEHVPSTGRGKPQRGETTSRVRNRRVQGNPSKTLDPIDRGAAVHLTAIGAT